MTAKEFIIKCSELTQIYSSLSKQQYIDFMREKFRVYESTKDAKIDRTLTRLQAHFNMGYFDLPMTEQPLFLISPNEN
mgnify:CR=1 FL=1|jgi:hypothetical protein